MNVNKMMELLNEAEAMLNQLKNNVKPTCTCGQCCKAPPVNTEEAQKAKTALDTANTNYDFNERMLGYLNYIITNYADDLLELRDELPQSDSRLPAMLRNCIMSIDNWSELISFMHIIDTDNLGIAEHELDEILEFLPESPLNTLNIDTIQDLLARWGGVGAGHTFSPAQIQLMYKKVDPATVQSCGSVLATPQPKDEADLDHSEEKEPEATPCASGKLAINFVPSKIAIGPRCLEKILGAGANSTLAKAVLYDDSQSALTQLVWDYLLTNDIVNFQEDSSKEDIVITFFDPNNRQLGFSVTHPGMQA